VKTKY